MGELGGVDVEAVEERHGGGSALVDTLQGLASKNGHQKDQASELYLGDQGKEAEEQEDGQEDR